MHIVMVHRGMPPERIGGTYSYIYELGRGLAARGHRVDVIASTKTSDVDTVTELEGMTIHGYVFRRLNPVYSRDRRRKSAMGEAPGEHVQDLP